jgi:hypothetical protein
VRRAERLLSSATQALHGLLMAAQPRRPARAA